MNIKTALLSLFFLAFATLLATEDSTKTINNTKKKPDSLHLVFKEFSLIVISEFKSAKELQEAWVLRKRKRPAKYMGIGLGVSSLLHNQKGFSLEPGYLQLDYTKSVHVQVNFFAYKVRFSNDFGLVLGAGFSFNHHSFKQKNQDLFFSASEIKHEELFGDKYKRYNFNVFDFHTPLLFEYAPIKTRFRVSLGVTLSYLFYNEFVKIYESEKLGTVREVRKNEGDIMPFQVHATGEIGYRFLSFYANYGMLQFFYSKANNQIHPLEMGLRLCF
jgi:hypothetical protein